jgi:hypothetical protein
MPPDSTSYSVFGKSVFNSAIIKSIRSTVSYTKVVCAEMFVDLHVKDGYCCLTLIKAEMC